MDFIEEKTPRGLSLRITFSTKQFLVFDRKGQSIYADAEGRKLMHSIPLLFVVGSKIFLKRNYEQPFSILKIKNGEIIFPFFHKAESKWKYLFLPTDELIDMIPVQLITANDFQELAKKADATLNPTFVIVDESISQNEIILIHNRFGTKEVVSSYETNNEYLVKNKPFKEGSGTQNLNMMSSNPVFLSSIQLRSMDLSNVNQLLLDFDLSALDADFILFMIQKLISGADSDIIVKKNLGMLNSLEENFKFYHYLMNRDDSLVRGMIDNSSTVRQLTPLKTLVMKAKSIHPGKEDQLLYTEYENQIDEKRKLIAKNE